MKETKMKQLRNSSFIGKQKSSLKYGCHNNNVQYTYLHIKVISQKEFILGQGFLFKVERERGRDQTKYNLASLGLGFFYHFTHKSMKHN